MIETTELIPRTLLTEVCANRDAAMDTIRKAIATLEAGHRLAREANDFADRAHGAACFYESDRSKQEAYQRLFLPLDSEKSFETYRRQVDARVWMNLLTLTSMHDMMDRTAKDELFKQLQDNVPEVTEDTVRATFRGLAGDAKLIFQRGLARAFIDLDRRFRSHDAFKIGSRIVLTRVFNEWGSWSWHGRMRETIIDIERVFAVLDGNKPGGRSLLEAIDQDRGHGYSPQQSCTESKYFRIRGFKNGNAHLWMLRDDLVEKANLVLAEYYGAVLPDGVPEDVTHSDIQACTAICKDLSFYRTPPAVIEKLLSDLYLTTDSHVLEPSAGDGAIVKALLARSARVYAIEVDRGRFEALRAIERTDSRLTAQHANFLRLTPVPIYTHVVMNPPFYGTHYMAHVMRAFDFLKPGGTLVSVLPASVEFNEGKKHEAFRAWCKTHSRGYGSPFRDLPPESFATSGTRINTCWIQLHKEAK